MKKISFLFLVVFLFAVVACAVGAKASKLKDMLIDNFEKGTITDNPAWWTFDNVKLKVVEILSENISSLGKYSLQIEGKTKAWYVGGLGMYLAKPVDSYTDITLDVYGNGEKSGMIKLELYDDDNYTKVLEQDKTYKPTKDDRFMYELKVTWNGWRKVVIPFEEFVDDNEGIGNDVFDPNGGKGSAGLLHIQLIIVASSETGMVNMKIDNIKIIKTEPVKTEEIRSEENE